MFDTCISGARVLTPEGLCSLHVLLKDGRVAALAPADAPAPEALETIDADGLHLLPGFIDIHRHADLTPFTDAPSIEVPQGVTTQICGNCGFSAAPSAPETFGALCDYAAPILGNIPPALCGMDMRAFLQAAAARPLRLNTGYLVGNGALRVCVKGFDPAPLSAGERSRLLGLLTDALCAGAMGLSLGLMYAPECYYETPELEAILSVAARMDKPVVAHMRGEGASVVSSVEEMIALAERTGARVHISHLKAAGRNVWGHAVDAFLARIDAARARGLDITFDAYPYAAGSTTLTTLLPPEALCGGTQALLARLRVPSARRAIADALRRERPGWDNLLATTGADRITVADSSVPQEIGRSLSELAAGCGLDAADLICELLMREEGRVTVVEHHMDPADVERILLRPECIVISDALYGASGSPHPRAYGAFPRFLRVFVRERRLLSLEAAAAKITSMPADFFGLRDRGRIAPGYHADLVLLDLTRLSDLATYESPRQLPEGIRAVFVNGQGQGGALHPTSLRAQGGALHPASLRAGLNPYASRDGRSHTAFPGVLLGAT